LEANASENKVHRIDSLVKTFQPLPKSNLWIPPVLKMAAFLITKTDKRDILIT
jgi:hypothetical protein